ncbi:hypothetical protein K435DRAFT_683074 [Dendrothele bispora CBS 962.96]|uniref:Uncharacterized protein n=1 Tax=Dendrothele bispora (strain CBS 962.96) TaxID=1314807 RepID=A0A4S8LDA8_DENBC|nr:hypothetical protein K435DRAFT_683074 [Dendrothele bispora CBS 962.96]
MVAAVEKKLLDSPCGLLTQVFCLLHIFNLVTKGVISPFVSKKKGSSGSEEEEDEEDEENEAKPTAANDMDDDADGNDDDAVLPLRDQNPVQDMEDEKMLDEISQELEAILGDRGIPVPLVDNEDLAIARSVFHKTRRLGHKIHFSASLQDELREICDHLKITYKTLKRLIDTRWNSLHTMWASFVDIEQALDELCDPSPKRRSCMVKLSKDQKALKSWKLTDEEWSLVNSIVPLLKTFVYAANHMQTSKRPMLIEVIEYMDTVNSILEQWVKDKSKPAVIRYGAAKGLGVLDKYYSKTDDSIMYQAAMGASSTISFFYFWLC